MILVWPPLHSNKYKQLPVLEHTYSVGNTNDDKEVALLKCNEQISTSSDDNSSSEEEYKEHPDDYHIIDESTMYNIRCSDNINRFKNTTDNDELFLHDERIWYSIDLHKRKIWRSF